MRGRMSPSSPLERRRLERDNDIRRRRHFRYLSQTSERASGATQSAEAAPQDQVISRSIELSPSRYTSNPWSSSSFGAYDHDRERFTNFSVSDDSSSSQFQTIEAQHENLSTQGHTQHHENSSSSVVYESPRELPQAFVDIATARDARDASNLMSGEGRNRLEDITSNVSVGGNTNHLVHMAAFDRTSYNAQLMLGRNRKDAIDLSFSPHPTELEQTSTLKQSTFSETILQELQHSITFLYSIETPPSGTDVWPAICDWRQAPARYVPVDLPGQKRSVDEVFNADQRQSQTYASADELTFDYDCQTTWPSQQLPSELYFLIAESLSRDDIKSMRLTCKEFEYHLSELFFKSVVVPFTATVFSTPSESKLDMKGKRKADLSTLMANSLSNTELVVGGENTFQTYGSMMKRFILSFQVDLCSLTRPPSKMTEQNIMSFWGEYQWPLSEYQRFSRLNRLEETADDTAKMKAAFSQLTNVKEFGIQLNSGLGWLSGPDKSVRTRILQRKQHVLGKIFKTPDRKAAAHSALWDHLQKWANTSSRFELKHCTVSSRTLTTSPVTFQSLMNRMICRPELPIPFADVQHIPDPTALSPQLHRALNMVLPGDVELLGGLLSVQSASSLADGINQPEQQESMRVFEGGICIVREDSADHERLDAYPLIPTNLSNFQKEWLLETEYAQNAFLSSWIIATMDNRLALSNVQTLNFAGLSSHYLQTLTRCDFWDALPQVQKLVLDIIPDVQEISKDNVGFVETTRVPPSTAHSALHKLLLTMVASRENLKSLTLGWVDGGEHAQGLTARNKHLMPAAILPAQSLLSAESLVMPSCIDQYMLHFPHVNNLTLKNSWITPYALVYLVQSHPLLEILNLESISLTAELSIHRGINVAALAQIANAPLPPPALPVVQNPLGPMGNFHITQPGFNNHATAPTNHAWTGPHRSGSWPSVLDQISPGRTLAAADIPSTTPTGGLKLLNLKSCGYCRLNDPRLDESDIPPLMYGGGSSYFSKRFSVLSRLVLSTHSLIHAEIVQCIPLVEGQALTLGFGLQLGWPDEWADEAEAPIYDGCLLGGIGRFTGVITSDSRPLPNMDEDML